MCGISGTIFLDRGNLAKKKAIIKGLLINLEERGTDASGIALINSRINHIEVLKNAVRSSHLIETNEYKEFMNKLTDDVDLVLLHSRLATQGKKENNNNNHPIYDKGNNNVLIHNGIIRNDEWLKRELELKTDGDCDSEIILRMYQKLGLKEALKKINGSYTFALYDNGILHLVRHDNPLWLAYIKDENIIAFASEQEIIKHSLVKDIFFDYFIKYDKNVVYNEIENDKHITIKLDEIKIDEEDIDCEDEKWVRKYDNFRVKKKGKKKQMPDWIADDKYEPLRYNEEDEAKEIAMSKLGYYYDNEARGWERAYVFEEDCYGVYGR